MLIIVAWTLFFFIDTSFAQNYYYSNAKEGDIMTLSCSGEVMAYTTYSGYVIPTPPYIIIDDIEYTYEDCSHSDNYGIKDRCDNQTSCSFIVTNAYVGSSCGNGGVAGLKVQYHCVRDGAWSTWSGYGGCTRTCGGGYMTRTRSCNNPPRNYFSNDRTCRDSRDYETARCNTGDCPSLSGSTCRNNYFQPVCYVYNTQGYMTINSANWREGCSWNYNTNNPYYDVTGQVQGYCNNRYSCTVYVTDGTLPNCYTDYYYAVYYTYTVYYYYDYYYDCSYYDDWWGWYWYQQCLGTALGSYTATTYYVARYTSICGIMYWTYTCRIPEWADWGQWSGCSVSCGYGTEFRTRGCDNPMNTLDGVQSQCAQSGSELQDTETRECLFKGTQPYCTYCDTIPFRYKDIGSITYNTDTAPGNGIILESDAHIIRCCGLINKWEFYAKNTGTLKFIVWRPSSKAGQESKRTVVGINTFTVTASDIGKVTQFIPSSNQRIAVIAGDFIGWEDGNGNIIAYDTCSSVLVTAAERPGSLTYVPNYCPTRTIKQSISVPVVGGSQTWSGPVISGRVYAVQYETTPNTKPFFSMPTYTASIPDHTAIDTSVMDFFFTDADYGDIIKDFSPDYSNTYFYFDTSKLSIHVKTSLPHLIGRHEWSGTYTAWAEDSCYNRVTGTVTVTVYNVGPMYPDFPTTVTVDDVNTGSLYTFRVTDPSGDPTTCALKGTSPTTSLFYVNGYSLMLNSGSSLTTSADSYWITVTCTDGTDPTEGSFTVNVRRNATEIGETQKYFYNTYAEGDSAILSCNSEVQAGLYSYTDYVPPADPYIVIDAVRYTYYTCDHTDTYGIKDMCENKTGCAFAVTNANIGSSCGSAEGVGGLFITWHCVRDGGWTSWSLWGDCSRTCAGGYKQRSRTCTNPSPNYFSKNKVCQSTRDYEKARCNTQDCTYSGTICRNDVFNIQCYDFNTYGRISITSATWTYGCGWNYNTINPAPQNVLSALGGLCTNYNKCSPTINDGNIGSCNTVSTYTGSSYSYSDTYWCQQYGWYSCSQTLSSTNTLPTYSICGKLYWSYSCITPQWALWSQWTGCSVTCGKGTQTRSRLCDNQYTTYDGTLRTCAQSGSELQSSETRDCLYNGTHPYCTYCGSSTYTYLDVNSFSNRYAYTTANGGLFLLESDVHIVRCCGKIASWTFYVRNSGTLYFYVWRKTGNDFQSSRKVIAYNSYTVASGSIGAVITYSVPASLQITVIAGDMIGWYDSNAIIAYDSCDSSYNPSTASLSDYRRNLCPTRTLVKNSGPPGVDSILDWNSGVTVISNQVFSLQYTTTPNTAPVFNMPIYSVSIPDYSKVDSSVIAFYFTDADYRDFYVNYDPPYDSSPYFYFDTRAYTVNVKTILPHQVGTRYHTYTFVVWAEDSCYNRVTGTVTITTYNGPPVFPNLPATVELSENRTSGDVYTFQITDPDSDTYTWSISSMVPANDIFYLNGKTVVQKDGAIFNTQTLASTYTIYITANDNTDVTTSYLVVNILRQTRIPMTYYFYDQLEGQTASLSCDGEKTTYYTYTNFVSPPDPYIIIDDVRYTFRECNHTDIYGVADMCENKTSCSFPVTNANVGSSCATNGMGGLYITYHCIKDGAWTTWGQWDSCTRSCDGGYQTRKRTCTNPSPNYFSKNEICQNTREYETRRCNTISCTYSGSTCRNSNFQPVCTSFNTDGKLEITSSIWKQGCQWNYNNADPYTDILGRIQGMCQNYFKCDVPINDALLSCYTDYYYNTTFDYTQTYWCHDKGWYTCNKLLPSYKTERYFSICGALYWAYTCVIPQWAIWSEWSSCSQTCGRGYQTRTRTCDNEYTTMDGKLQTCAQANSELQSKETRECLLNGTHPYCTYCEEKTYNYRDVTTLSPVADTTPGNAYLLESDIEIVSCCGLIKQWKFFPKNAGTLKLIVWRPAVWSRDMWNQAGVYGYRELRTVVGINTVVITGANLNQVYSYTPTIAERITIVAGDRIGWYDGGANIIGYQSCDSTANPSTNDHTDYRYNYCPTKTRKITTTAPSDGSLVDWTAASIADRVYAIEFSTTTNTPPYFNMATYNVAIPDHSAIDSYVMDFYFNDTDYADFFMDMQPEYDLEPYFYLDTRSNSIHVKSTLPHVVGTHEKLHTFVVWAEDSCYNRVTGTVTITTYNVPPQYPYLPVSLYIDDIQTGSLYTFTRVDPSNGADPISCTISSVVPATPIFQLVGETITLKSGQTLDINRDPQYLIYLSCYDNTDYGISYVTFIIRHNITEIGLPEAYYYYNTTEGLVATLTCVPENEPYQTYPGYIAPLDPYIIIDIVRYVFYSQCNYTDLYGVRDMCENKTDCTFEVTNAHVGSSCGSQVDGLTGQAGLYIVYHCVKDGGWTTWGEWGECSRTCGGGWRRRERNFTNPTPNYFSKREVYEDGINYDMERCYTQDCPYNGSTCRMTNFEPVCNSHNTKGYLTITQANYTFGCAWNYNTLDVWHDVTSILQGYCGYYYYCPQIISDANLVLCSTDYPHYSYHNFSDTYLCGQTGWKCCERTNTSVLNHRYLSYCGIVYWDYNCTIPQWAYWTAWSTCSVACGRGSQQRTRVCDNEYNTKDGYQQRCNQPGSELHNLETRDCPLKGAHNYCTYCGSNTYTYKDVSSFSNNYGYTTSNGRLFLLESDVHLVTCCGKIATWKFYARNTGTLYFYVWRKTGNDFQGLRKVIAYNSYTVSSAGQVITYTVPASSQITVIEGDMIGWYDSNSIIAYDSCDSTFDPSTASQHDYRKNLCPTRTLVKNWVVAVEDSVVDWNNSVTVISDQVFGLQYSTTPNTAPVFSMPIYSVSIPDYSKIDANVIPLYFTDADYKDFYVNYDPPYDSSPYFYFDTTAYTVNVKTALPHEVGTRYHTYTFVVKAEDSCYNQVTGTVSITTYNGPPVFPNLPATVELSENRTSGDVYTFQITDPDSDTYTWSISSMVPANDIFYLNGKTVVQKDGAIFNTQTLASTYTIYIMANDNTDVTTSYLVVNILRQTRIPMTYYFYDQLEGQTASLSCDGEKTTYYAYTDFVSPPDPYIIIDDVRYTFRECNHTDIYGVADMCENKTSCSFPVTNANVGSSCATNGMGGLYITYHCIKDGAWTTWGQWDSCSRSCDGGYQTRKRTCTNPSPNYFSKNEICEDTREYETRRCNTISCTYSGSTCRNTNFQPVCTSFNTDGKLEITSSIWKQGCEWNYNNDDPEHDILTTIQGMCQNYFKCDVPILDGLLSCYTDYDYNTMFVYTQAYWCHYTGWSMCNKLQSSYKTERYLSICGALYWGYTCVIPQWAIWSEWSSCSQTCGRGYQTRTRTCDNEYTTMDGKLQTCAQANSELQSKETRECLLNGTHPHCTYCEEKTYSYRDVSTLTPVADTTPGNAYLLESDIEIVSCCGLIKEWKIFPVNTGTLKLIVWRPAVWTRDMWNQAGVYGYRELRKVVGINTVVITGGDINKVFTYTPTNAERITIVAGDRIGWYDGGANIIGYDSCDSTANPSTSDHTDYRYNYCPTKTRKITTTAPSDGSLVDWTAASIADRVYAIEFSTTTNTPPYFNMATYSVAIVDHSAIDSYVMDFYFNDTDYADFFMDMQPEYDLEPFFYLDTRSNSIHVKSTLPHVIGTHQHLHTFVVWAEDSCYNRVTGTVTITTYNVPPQYPYLPETVEIDDIQTGSLYTFTRVDPSNGADPISCTISSVEPATTIFELVAENITLKSGQSLDKSRDPQYLIHLSCYDNTDYGISNVTFIIRHNITEIGIPEVYYYYNTTEELVATLTCVPENEPYDIYTGYIAPRDPYIIIDAVRYVFYNHKCNQSDSYGVSDMCENKTDCTFNVTNANVGSSCGSEQYGLNGLAGLYIVYHCIKDGGWTTWGEWGECSRTCGGGWRRRERNFTNPSPNYFSKREVYEDAIHYDMERCYTQDCPYNGSTCRMTNFEPVCNSYNTKGYLTITQANYTFGCAWNYNTLDVWHDVTSILQGYCGNHYFCSEIISDPNLVFCSTDYPHYSYHNFSDTYLCGQTGWKWCERTNTSVLNHRYLSYCGIVYWDYNCTIPQWAYWTPWSSCSVPCGYGFQQRSRVCDNEFNTIDGNQQRCNQPGSELHNLETRDCPLKGKHDYCPYCGTGTYSNYMTLTTNAASYFTDSLPGNAYLLESDIDKVTCCGKIYQWRIFARNTGNIKFIVWRVTVHPGDNYYRKVVGTYQVTVSSTGYNTFTPPAAQSITIIPGDLIGWYDYGNNIIGYQTCDSSYDPSTNDHRDFRINYCPTKTKKITTTDPVDDNMVDWNTTYIKDRDYAIEYTTTPNTAPYFTMGTYSVSIPDYTAKDTSVIDFYFTDADYADFYRDFQPMYDNHPYFYLDTTTLGSIHVKTKLPHDVGTKYHYYTYTASAEDSCYNWVTGTVTITTYNWPPVFTDLPGAVNISELQWGGEVYTFGLEDPDNDTLTWGITSYSPNTDFFYLENKTIYLHDLADLDYKTVNRYVVSIWANDGTEISTTTLTIDLIEHIVLVPKYYEYTSQEGLNATLSCMPEYELSYTYTDYIAPRPIYIIVDNVTYQDNHNKHYGCLHNLTYGVKDRCDNFTSCTFEVTNANVASQCGTNGVADLWVRYHCVRDAGWTTWNNWHDCTRTCGGGYRVRYRNCSNPTWNYFGSDRDCQDSKPYEWERCNTFTCAYSGATCRNDWFSPVCYIYNTNGTLGIQKTNWTHGCAWDYNTDDYWFFKPEDKNQDGIVYVQSLCENYRDCEVLVNDSMTPSGMPWCHTTNDYDVEFTYTEYYRCGWGWLTCSRTKVGYYTNCYIQFCGVIYWDYSCNIPQWSQWTQWTDCSLTCDRGIQTRTRYCEPLTESNTFDGYNNTCGQLYDETHTLETRECLLLGNHRYCTYCEHRDFSYLPLENMTLGPVNDTEQGTAYILESAIDIVRCCGLIANWTFYPVNVGTLKFVVWRSIGVPGYREVVGTNSVNVSLSDLNKLNTYTPPKNERISMIARDMIGWYDGGAKILSYDICDSLYNASTREHRDLRPWYCPTDTFMITTEDPQDGDVVNWNGTKDILKERVYALEYTTVENTPPYFNMSRYDKTIPDHAAIDFSIMDFFFNDTDYADWFVDYQPEYDGDLYFYYDTFAKSIHVKDYLLHIIGQRNQYHYFIIWAEDSCYNRVTGTVTITTFNGPPTFPDMNKVITVSESKTGQLFSFKVEDPSRGPDPITCSFLKSIPPTTNFFYLSGQSIYLNTTAKLNAKATGEYEIYIECNDGTDTTQAFLRVEISKAQDDTEGPPDWVKTESFVLVAVTIASVSVSLFTILNLISNGMSAFTVYN